MIVFLIYLSLSTTALFPKTALPQPKALIRGNRNTVPLSGSQKRWHTIAFAANLTTNELAIVWQVWKEPPKNTASYKRTGGKLITFRTVLYAVIHTAGSVDSPYSLYIYIYYLRRYYLRWQGIVNAAGSGFPNPKTSTGLYVLMLLWWLYRKSVHHCTKTQSAFVFSFVICQNGTKLEERLFFTFLLRLVVPKVDLTWLWGRKYYTKCACLAPYEHQEITLLDNRLQICNPIKKKKLRSYKTIPLNGGKRRLAVDVNE